MKRSILYTLFVMFSLACIACAPQEEKKVQTDNQISGDNIEVYYFHFSRRCATCNAVEAVTQEALKEYFAEAVEAGTIEFKSLNLDEESNEALAEQLKVSGQTLLFVSGDKSVNLTTEAFMNAKGNPDKLKEQVKATVEQLLK